jgi:hypothetical protein
VDTRDIIEGFEVPGTAQLPGEIERILPQVHTTWGFIVPGLKAHAQPARLEAALALIAHVAECSGNFISKRMQTDVLPQLKRIISGSSSISTRARARSGGSIRVVDNVAPGTVARCQVVAFNTLERMCQHSNGREALKNIISELAADSAEILCRGSSGSAVREKCAAALQALASVDGEAVRSALELREQATISQVVHPLIQSLLDEARKNKTPSSKGTLDGNAADVPEYLNDLDINAST